MKVKASNALETLKVEATEHRHTRKKELTRDVEATDLRRDDMHTTRKL